MLSILTRRRGKNCERKSHPFTVSRFRTLLSVPNDRQGTPHIGARAIQAKHVRIDSCRCGILQNAVTLDREQFDSIELDSEEWESLVVSQILQLEGA